MLRQSCPQNLFQSSRPSHSFTVTVCKYERKEEFMELHQTSIIRLRVTNNSHQTWQACTTGTGGSSSIINILNGKTNGGCCWLVDKLLLYNSMYIFHYLLALYYNHTFTILYVSPNFTVLVLFFCCSNNQPQIKGYTYMHTWTWVSSVDSSKKKLAQIIALHHHPTSLSNLNFLLSTQKLDEKGQQDHICIRNLRNITSSSSLHHAMLE